MSVEQQIRDAFDELDELLNEGLEIEVALAQAATNNGLRPEIFRARAERMVGDLGNYESLWKLRAKNSLQHSRFLSELSRFIEKFYHEEGRTITPNVVDYLSEKLGRDLTPDEVKEAKARHEASFYQTLERNVARMFHDQGLSNAQDR